MMYYSVQAEIPHDTIESTIKMINQDLKYTQHFLKNSVPYKAMK